MLYSVIIGGVIMQPKKGKKYLLNLDLTISGILLGVLILLTMVGVVFRYFINRPIPWVEEIQTTLILWVMFLGGSAAFRKAEHMTMEFVYDKLSAKNKRFLDVLIYIVTVFALGYFGVQGWKLINLYAKSNRITSILHIPGQYVYLIVPIGCVLMIISETIYFWEKLHGRVELTEIEKWISDSDSSDDSEEVVQ